MYLFLRDLVDPLTLPMLLLGAALTWGWWKHPDARKALRWITAAYALAWIASTGVVAYLAAGALEWGYPPVVAMPDDAEAIVLLSGGAYMANDFLPETWPAPDTLRRCRLAAQLYHTRPCPIVACGGKLRREPDGDTLADVMQRTLLQMGVREEDILLESTSSDTYENARNAKRIVEEHGWTRVVLVTDGMHLPRANLCLKKQGVDASGAGAYYGATQFGGRAADFFPRSGSAVKTSYAMHEALGLLWYKLRGRI